MYEMKVANALHLLVYNNLPKYLLFTEMGSFLIDVKITKSYFLTFSDVIIYSFFFFNVYCIFNNIT
jgi:hypothetical protein